MLEQRTYERLLEWGEALKREGNGLGNSLVENAQAWKAEVEQLRGEVADLCEIKRLADTPLVILLTQAKALTAAMIEVAEFSEGHHGDQERHVLLHALRVDIPSRLRQAAKAAGGEWEHRVFFEVRQLTIARGEYGPGHELDTLQVLSSQAEQSETRRAEVERLRAENARLRKALDRNLCPECEAIDEEDAWEEEGEENG